MQHNALLADLDAEIAPDGDAKLDDLDFTEIVLPQCEHCGGALKPDVVFYGENVPAQRVQSCFEEVDQADAILVVGSSLMVYSGYRFVRRAHDTGLPVVSINRGVTRADDIVSLKIEQDCGEALNQAVLSLSSHT